MSTTKAWISDAHDFLRREQQADTADWDWTDELDRCHICDARDFDPESGEFRRCFATPEKATP